MTDFIVALEDFHRGAPAGVRDKLFGDVFGRHVSLEGVAFGPGQLGADRAHVVLRVPVFDHRGAEFVIAAAVLDKLDAAADSVRVETPAAADFSIAGQWRFVVHGDVIQQRQHRLDHLRLSAVGVKLDAEAVLADMLDEICELWMQGGFTAGDADRIDPVFAAGIQRLEQPFPVDVAIAGTGQVGVVAEKAAQVAAGDEQNPAEVSGVVDQARPAQHGVDRAETILAVFDGAGGDRFHNFRLLPESFPGPGPAVS